ncbi:MAG: hypothetical protein QG574_5333 [Cyanobacteriota bacterium erpe_2018_sw_21hr_WHONDRS-SW48-000092_B_bin.40]|nr:hypothetical protein [Cyanobacteriota bacterium erpe_2018_sw_21hr_WHONDRS-SW48-000092_B_bin.40]
MTARKHNTLLYILLVCLVPLTMWLHAGVASSLKRLHGGSEVVFIPSAQAVRLVALGYDQLLADFYWLAFVSYVGDGAARSKDHSVMADKYLDLITSLDPYFVQPYWFCAFTVGAEQKRPLRANEIIKRGIRANLDNWYLPYIAGINMYLYAHDEVAAAKYYADAAKLPAAPPWIARQAMILAAKIPSTIKEINTWDSIYRSEKSNLIHAKAKEKLIQLWSRVYSASPKGVIREKARKALSELGVNL